MVGRVFKLIITKGWNNNQGALTQEGLNPGQKRFASGWRGEVLLVGKNIFSNNGYLKHRKLRQLRSSDIK